MDNMVVKSGSHSYPVYIGHNILSELSHLIKENYSSILIITDDQVAPLYLDIVKEGLNCKELATEIIPAGEASKRMDIFYQLHTKAIQYGLDRNSLIIALGGGVVGDLAGFVAATYMRGIDYIQVPTTILAHDSSVGGKVAINHELGKNLIGSFHAPRMVVYDVKTLETLPAKEIRSGYAELIKEAFIGDKHFLADLLRTDLQDLNEELLIRHLKKGIQIKASIVEIDEKEQGKRQVLNLGHTLGHALEAELGYGTMTHGEAVAIGLLFALFVSQRVFFQSILPLKQLLTWFLNQGYPIKLRSLNEDALLNRMRSDKKTINHHINMVLLKDISKPVVLGIDDTNLLSYLRDFFIEVIHDENL